MHPEENGAVEDRFAKQSSEYDAAGVATLRSKVLNNEPQSMHPEENGAVKNSEDR